MRKLLFLLLLSGSCLAGFAQGVTERAKVLTTKDIESKGGIKLTEMAQAAHPFTLSRKLDKAQAAALAKQCVGKNAATAPAAKRVLRRAAGEVDTVQYFSAVRSYYEGYTFKSDGGDVFSFDLGIAVEGNKVTFKNLFSLYNPSDYSPSTDVPVVGTYDAEKKTITIPTKTNFAEATIAGYFYNYYPAVLMCGTITESGKLAPDNELVFTVEGDFDYITTDQAVCAFMYTADGSQSYGVQEAFKKMHIQKPTAGAKLVTMSEEVKVGSAFPNTEIAKTFSLVNLGNDAADFAAETEADDNATFNVDPFSGTVAGQGIQTVNVKFKGTKAGEYEGVSTFEWDGSDAAEPFMVTYNATVLDYPDYSEAVKNGDLEMTTDIDYPFFMDTLDDGTPVASSNTQGVGNSSSKLYVKFTVPEGKLGKFSWKGVSTNEAYWYYNAGGVFVDDEKFSAFTETADISDAVELAPGEHTVRFQYDSYYYTGVAANRLYVYDLDLELSDLEPDAAELKTSSLDLGQFICEEGAPATGSGTISILNKGANMLTVKSATIDGDVFTIDQNFGSAPTMQTVDITVNMEASKAGEYNHTATLVTTAGTFTVPVKALVRDMPDFQSIVKEGTFTFTTSAEHPWLVENGVAYNSTAKVPDYEPTTASFKASFTVPEGKLGILSWDGEMSSRESPDPTNWYYSDYGRIEFQHPMAGGQKDVPGGVRSASSASTYGSDEYWADYLYCVPGEHYLQFHYLQIGDSIYGGEDKMTIHNLSLHLIDYADHSAQLLTESVKFDSTFVGYNRYTTATVTLKNVGSKPLKVLDIPQAGAFYGVIPTDSVQFSKTLDVTLWFFPTAPGEYKDSITIKTNGGDYKVACEGVAKSSDDYVYVGDLEDDAYGWSYYDADKDGECWNLGSNLFGGEYPEYCHSGKQCLGSASYSYYNGDITPNNWLFSPQITIPEDGAVLTWAAAEQSKRRAGDHYSVYVDTNDNIADANNLDNLTPIFSETLDSTKVDTWSEQSYDLSQWAGKTIVVAFRHHDCTGNYLIRLDDVFVWKKDAYTGIDAAKATDKRVARQEYFDLTGKRLDAPKSGLTLVRTVYADGSCTTTKTLRK